MKKKSTTVLETMLSLSKVPPYAPAAVKKLMSRYSLDVRIFALLMNVTPQTVKLWIAGAVKPCGLSRRLMQLLDCCPESIEAITQPKDDADC